MKQKSFSFTISAISIFTLSLTSCSSSNLLYEAKEVAQFTYNDGFINYLNNVSLFSSDFSETLYQNYKNGDNIVYSPISVYLCLGVAAEISQNNTREEILNALNTNYTDLNKNYHILFESLNKEFESGQLSLTNSIWLNDSCQFIDSTLEKIADDYYTYSYRVDYTTNEANNAIREFIIEKTNGFLNPLLNFDPQTIFVLMNTLYLKDNWTLSGSDLSTYQDRINFINSDNTITNTDMLSSGYKDKNIYVGDTFKSCYISTVNGYNLNFFVPLDGYSVEDIFTAENINLVNTDPSIFASVDEEKEVIYNTNVIFPEFEAEFDENLIDIMTNEYGIKDLFSAESCDLSPIFSDDAYASSLRHIAKLKTDKKGIEGAAVTLLVTDGATSSPLYPIEKQEFIVDRSFGFTVTDSHGICLFSGVVEKI